MLILTLSACHLFSSAEIPCARDELPGCLDTAEADTDTDSDADSDADSDTDTDTDTDTDVVGDPTAGLVMSVRGSSDWLVRVLDQQGAESFSYGQAGAVFGPVAWDEAGQVAYVASNGDGDLYKIGSSCPQSLGPLGGVAVDLAINGSWLYATDGTNLVRLSLSSGATEPLSSELTQALQLIPDKGDGVYIIDRGSGSPSLLHYESGSVTMSVANYDSIDARSVGAYLREGEVWLCSEGGGTWSVGQLKSGDSTPERLAQGAITDVIDCGYDAGSDEVLFFSVSRGVFRVGSDNATTEWATGAGGLIQRGEVLP